MSSTTAVICFGENTYGQIGHKDYQEAKRPPFIVQDLEDVAYISCGCTHTLAVTNSGDLFTWGCGYLGALGVGNTNNACTPQKVEGELKDKKVVSAAGGMNVSFAVTDDGEVYAWGANEFGELGMGDLFARFSPELNTYFSENGIKIKEVKCGGRHTFFVTQTGELYGAGWNHRGQLGIGNTNDCKSPVKLSESAFQGRKIKSVACGTKHSVAVTVDGDVYAWGSSRESRLGFKASSSAVTAPALVPTLKGKNVMEVACGSKHTAVLTAFSQLFVWGSNICGQCLFTTKTVIDVPMEIKYFTEKAANPLLFVACAAGATIVTSGLRDAHIWGEAIHHPGIVIPSKPPVLTSGIECASLGPAVLEILSLSGGVSHIAVIARIDKALVPHEEHGDGVAGGLDTVGLPSQSKSSDDFTIHHMHAHMQSEDSSTSSPKQESGASLEIPGESTDYMAYSSGDDAEDLRRSPSGKMKKQDKSEPGRISISMSMNDISLKAKTPSTTSTGRRFPFWGRGSADGSGSASQPITVSVSPPTPKS